MRFLHRFCLHWSDLVCPMCRVALKCVRSDTRSAQQHKVNYQLGRFTDRIFQTLHAKQQSVEHEAKCKLIAHNRKKIDALNRTLAQQERELKAMAVPAMNTPAYTTYATAHAAKRELQYFVSTLEKEYAIDADELKGFETNLYASLEKSVEQYAECLKSGDQYNGVVVYRLVSLWFTHYLTRPVSDTQRKIYADLKAVPSFKWLPLVYQMASRLASPAFTTTPVSAAVAAASGGSTQTVPTTSEQKQFRTTLNDIIFKMAVDHPYHTLYQIYALRHGDKLHATSKVKDGFEANRDRIQAAIDVLDRVKRVSSKHSTLVTAFGNLINAYIDLGGKTWSKHDRTIKLADTALGKLGRETHLHLIPVPTITVPVRSDAKYGIDGSVSAIGSTGGDDSDDRIVMISRFEPDIKFATTGLNRPLIMRVLGSDGLIYQQLLKSGADDLRQDAVMEQLFQLVNTQLSNTTDTRQRQLHIRTYNVVPLTPCVGLVEWVQHTISLADLLTQSLLGAHDRYRPAHQQKSYAEWHVYIREGATDKPSLPKRFAMACADMPPVFHRYFLDSWSDPQVWFQKRLAYTRSVAVASMCGYILGLGDRHNANILLDKHTAELVHVRVTTTSS